MIYIGLNNIINSLHLTLAWRNHWHIMVLMQLPFSLLWTFSFWHFFKIKIIAVHHHGMAVSFSQTLIMIHIPYLIYYNLVSNTMHTSQICHFEVFLCWHITSWGKCDLVFITSLCSHLEPHKQNSAISIREDFRCNRSPPLSSHFAMYPPATIRSNTATQRVTNLQTLIKF